MKAKHIIVMGLILVGALFIFHNYMSHGGTAGVKNGLGFGSGGA